MSPLSKPSAKRRRNAAGLEGAEVVAPDRSVSRSSRGSVEPSEATQPAGSRWLIAGLPPRSARRAAPRTGDHLRAAVVRQALEHRTDLEQDAGQVAVDAAGADRPGVRVLEQVVALGRDQAAAVVGERSDGSASRLSARIELARKTRSVGGSRAGPPGRSRRRRRVGPSDRRGCRRWSRSRRQPWLGDEQATAVAVRGVVADRHVDEPEPTELSWKSAPPFDATLLSKVESRSARSRLRCSLRPSLAVRDVLQEALNRDLERSALLVEAAAVGRNRRRSRPSTSGRPGCRCRRRRSLPRHR